MEKLDVKNLFYFPYCNHEEIERISNLQTNEDYLLKMRADEVANHVRLYRVMRARILKDEKNWNFTEHFSKVEFERYLGRLDEENRNKVSCIAKGFIFSNDPNGSCIRSPFGDVIIVSESLKYFFFFMNLHFLNFDSSIEVPPDVRNAALIIAIRTMLKTEALDFELDPRGIIPKEIQIMNDNFVQKQLEFVIGHEYAHCLLGHLDKEKVVEKPLYRMLQNESNVDLREYKFYSYEQKQEFEADVHAFKFANFKESELESYLWAGLLFFIYLDVYRSVSEVIFPPIHNRKTHPDPIDRMWNLYGEFQSQLNSINKGFIEELLQYTSKVKEFLQDDVGYNIEQYESYGSIYLGQWRGPKLRDRIDY